MASTIRGTTVKWGLAEFPVALRKASEPQDVKFDYAVELPDGSMTPRKQVYVGEIAVDIEDPTEIIEGTLAIESNTYQGAWVGDEFHRISADDIETIKNAGQIESIEIEEFIDLKDVPWGRAMDGYYLAPQKGGVGAKPLKMLRDAMKGEKAAGLVKFCVKGTAGRQKLGAIYEEDGRVRVTVLAFADAMRQADDDERRMMDAQVARPVVTMARKLVREMKGEGKLLDEARDDTVEARAKLLQDAIDGLPVEAPKKKAKVAAADADDLMATLYASIERAKVTA